jgi:hypothetical protein
LQYYIIVLKLTLYRRCDNRTEFKGEVAQLCKELSIRIIRGRPYHPQTQGTLERANCTFKRRLGALQAQRGRSDWVALLLELALVINTTTTRALPRHKTPFEVWFGRKPRWITAGLIDDTDDEDQDLQDDTDNDSSDDEDPVLSKIEAQVVTNNAKLHAQIIKANSGQSAVFTDRAIATLQILLKLRLATEPSRLPVRVLEYKNGQYKLQSRHRRLAGRFQGRELNSIDPSISDLLGNSIRTEPEKKAGKEVTIKFPAAVAKENNRGSINSAQKAGRTAKSVLKSRGKGNRKGKGKQVEVVAIEDDGEAGDGDASEPVLVPKPRGKPGPKPGRKRKRTETEVETPSPRKLRKRA